jgi:hypothetical protein
MWMFFAGAGVGLIAGVVLTAGGFLLLMRFGVHE